MSSTPLVAVKANPHFERLGGEPAVQRLVEAFYGAMDSRPDARTIRAMHGFDLSSTKAVLVTYLSEWLGGPQRYSAERGAPRLGRVHRAFWIDGAARDAWLSCMEQALDECAVEAELRATLSAAFHKLAAHLQNH